MKKPIYICTALIVIILGIGFYFYGLRPAIIVKKCSLSVQKLLKTDGLVAQTLVKDSEDRYNFSYNRCLHDHGLKD